MLTGWVFAKDGIIPTRMGTRKADILPLQIPLDHPHAYGDKRDSAPLSFTYSGSSPRVWGQEQALREDAMQQRIIPTRVGTSDSFTSDTPQGRDHPHACGDKHLTACAVPFVSGSSPRVWGQAYSRLAAKYRIRIIPTRVGTS